MNLPLISIIVPVYKVEEYLTECVISIVNQTYKNLEIILVDDGSPDASGRICDDLAKKDDRIKVIHKSNGGLSDARNIGIDNCHGKYIAFIDSDDKVERQYIEVLYNLISSGDYQISKIGIQPISERGQKLKTNFKNKKATTFVWDKKEFIEGLLSHKTSWAAWTCLYPKQFFDTIRFTKKQYNEDCLMWIDGAEKVKTAIISNQCLYDYRQRRNSITSTKNIRFFVDQLCHATLWYKKIKKNYPSLIEAASNEYYLDLLAYMRAISDEKTIKKCIVVYRKNIFKILSNKYIPVKFKLMLVSICIFPQTTLNFLH